MEGEGNGPRGDFHFETLALAAEWRMSWREATVESGGRHHTQAVMVAWVRVAEAEQCGHVSHVQEVQLTDLLDRISIAVEGNNLNNVS